MTDTMMEERRAVSKTAEWSKRIATQQRSGMSVKQFCKEQGLTECSFTLGANACEKASQYVSHWWTEERQVGKHWQT